MNTLFIALKDKIPSDSYPFMSQKFENLNEEQIRSLEILALKSPLIGLVLGFFFGCFGVDRFYKGDIFLGILKLITLGLFGIWAILDLYFVFVGIKKDNLVKINNTI